MKYFLLLISVLIATDLYSQCPTGDVNLSTQSELDNFINTYSSCTIINGNLTLTGDIIDISGLNIIEEINGSLLINNTLIEKIEDFSGLKNISGDLILESNSRLIILNGFSNLLKIEGNFVIRENHRLSDSNGFHQLVSIGKDFLVTKSYIIEMYGFQNLKIIKGNFEISEIPHGLPLFESLEKIGGGFIIKTTGINHITGFQSLVSVGELHPQKWFHIENNEELIELSGFNSLKRIYGWFKLINNPNLPNIKGIRSLVKIDGYMEIMQNSSLTSLDGLQTLIAVSETSTPEGLIIQDNIALTDCSAICQLLGNRGVYGLVTILNNPSKCSTEMEIKEDCILDFDKDGIEDEIDEDDDNDGILDIDEEQGDPSRDTDLDNYPDRIDLDSDNDGCFDVVEAGFNDPDNNGTLGSSPDDVNDRGLIINEPDGYTTPSTNSITGVYYFQEVNNLNAGEDNEITLCIGEPPIDLFEFLGNEADPNGKWVPETQAGNGVFDPATDPSGSYMYTLENSTCGISSATIIVNIEESTSITNYTIEASGTGGDGSIRVLSASNGNHQYSLNGSPYQINNQFHDLEGGEHRLVIKEIDGCGVAEEIVYLLNYIDYFSPNNDGYNDTWKLVSELEENYTLKIYDRYGKLLKMLYPNQVWDGTFNGKLMPSDDYWFTMEFENKPSQSGHFTLLR